MPVSDIIFSFCRFQPPTEGHRLLMDKVLSLANSRNSSPIKHVVFPSHTVDKKYNPLDAITKLYFLEKAFPEINFVYDPKIRNPFDVFRMFSDVGIKNVTMVTGSDREKEFEAMVDPYLIHPDPKKRLNFTNVNIISCGKRCKSIYPDNISGTIARNAAREDYFKTFAYCLPQNLTIMDATYLYNKVRLGLGLQVNEKNIPDIRREGIGKIEREITELASRIGRN